MMRDCDVKFMARQSSIWRGALLPLKCRSTIKALRTVESKVLHNVESRQLPDLVALVVIRLEKALEFRVEVDLELVVFRSHTQIYVVRDCVIRIKFEEAHRNRSTLIADDCINRIEKLLDRVDRSWDLKEI